ncbi:hypothetical protein B5X24_HaOG214636 [Helicoverpa armigera]|nr:hypothetical protein B5X24_HaOG214636 [Helicoverpa armigera]
MTKNEIDFIMTNKKHIVRDVSLINRFNTGSDHRLVRGSLNINFKAERFRLMKARLRPTLLQTISGSETFQSNLPPWKPQQTLETTPEPRICGSDPQGGRVDIL